MSKESTPGSKQSTPAPLTAEYLENHALTAHTIESFGRALIGYAMEQAQKQVAKDGTATTSIEVNIPLTIKSNTFDCINVHVPGLGGFHLSNAI